MIIRDKIKRLAFFLKGDGGLHHPEIISEVQRAAGLDAGQNSHGKILTTKDTKDTKKNGLPAAGQRRKVAV